MEAINPTMGEAARKVRDGAVEFTGAAVGTANETLKSACAQSKEVIKDNPYTSVLVAFGVGAVLGALIARR